jgi:hypothetical protein
MQAPFLTIFNYSFLSVLWFYKRIYIHFAMYSEILEKTKHFFFYIFLSTSDSKILFHFISILKKTAKNVLFLFIICYIYRSKNYNIQLNLMTIKK